MGNGLNLHLHDVNPHVTKDDEGRRVVEALCEHYFPADKVVSIPDYLWWTKEKGYTTNSFCGHCRKTHDIRVGCFPGTTLNRERREGA